MLSLWMFLACLPCIENFYFFVSESLLFGGLCPIFIALQMLIMKTVDTLIYWMELGIQIFNV